MRLDVVVERLISREYSIALIQNANLEATKGLSAKKSRPQCASVEKAEQRAQPPAIERRCLVLKSLKFDEVSSFISQGSACCAPLPYAL